MDCQEFYTIIYFIFLFFDSASQCSQLYYAAMMIVIPEKEIPKKAKTFFENPSYVIRFTQPFSHSWIHHSSYRSLHFMKPKLCKIYFSRLTTLHTNRILKCLIYARNVNKRKIIRTLKLKRNWQCDARYLFNYFYIHYYTWLWLLPLLIKRS